MKEKTMLDKALDFIVETQEDKKLLLKDSILVIHWF